MLKYSTFRKNSTLKHLAVLNKYFIKYKWHLLGGILFVALSNYFRVLQPQIIRQALDLVFENVAYYKIMSGFEARSELVGGMSKLLLFFGALVLLLALLMGIFMYFMRQTIIVMSRLIEYDLRKEIFAHYEDMDLAFFKKNNTGDLMARITEDVNKVRMYLGPALLYGINLSTLCILVIYAMFSVNTTLSWYTLLPLPILSLSIYYVSNIINKKSAQIQRQLSSLNSIAQEVYSGIRVVKSYAQERQFGKFFLGESNNYKDKTLELAKVNALFFPLMILLIGISTILTIYIGGILVSRGQISPGNIAEFVLYVNMLTWPVTAVGWVASIINQAEASQQRINEFLDTKADIINKENGSTLIEGEIEFKNVSFVYPDTGTKALDNVSFKLKKGEKLAIIGKTASGKSTIADLLLRMYNVSEGVILIDGEPIEEKDLNTLREKIGFVPQDLFLFSDTVAKNISFAKEEASIEEIKQYAEYAAVKNDIETLPEKFETLVGERGVTLSGGQKQRISIARAFIKKPNIVILDDCLSAVDSNTEHQILSYLNEAIEDKTAIIITHRISGLINFDKIIALDQGKIIEEGTHEELLGQKGYYFNILEQQNMDDVEN